MRRICTPSGNISKGHDGVHELPANYLDQGKYYDKVKQPGKTYSKWGGILAEKNAFDPLFLIFHPVKRRR
ncbi:hypothetical protein KQR57_05270 [Bacillus inaquosorum]|nr:hypothetical protein [Bacillus inaquosorum]